MTIANEPAFPVAAMDAVEGTIFQEGLTKRELLAGLAMANMATKYEGSYTQSDYDKQAHILHEKWVADAAVRYADALLKRLEEK